MHTASINMSSIYRLCLAADDLRCRMAQTTHRHRYRMRKAFLRLHDRIRRRVADLHWKLANWLCENHDLILIPSFETQSMIRRGHRRLRSKTVRQMCTWSHFTFRQRLVSKAREFPGCRVVVTSEAYSSKTCGQCGHLHSKLGGSKVFQCPSCGFEVDRDANGARNILLRACTRKGVELQQRSSGRKRARTHNKSDKRSCSPLVALGPTP